MRRIRDLAPPDFERQLEDARLDLLALFRALDQLDLTPNEIPQPILRELFELDADFAEALGTRAEDYSDIDLLANAVAAEAKSGDHILIMSNGGFGGVHQRILSKLQAHSQFER